MAFELDGVVPWGRRLCEYRDMFDLSDEDILSKRIMSVGDGPASVNAEATRLGGRVLSVDPTDSPKASSGIALTRCETPSWSRHGAT